MFFNRTCKQLVNYKYSPLIFSANYPSIATKRCNRVQYTPYVDANAVALNNIADNPLALKQKRRLGRGIGSSKGKTCGRGMKGEKARHGNPNIGYEGGQSGWKHRVRKWGQKSRQIDYERINLMRLQQWIDTGRLDASQTITMKHLLDSGIITKIKRGVKLLGGGKQFFGGKIDIEVSHVSEEAREVIESHGGTVKCVYFNKVALLGFLKPQKYPNGPPKVAVPPYSEWYRYDDYKEYAFDSEKLKELTRPE